MATKDEIREWLEHCGAKEWQLLVYKTQPPECLFSLQARDKYFLSESATPLHLLNESATAVQGPTFAEWKKQKGREGKVEKIREVLEVMVGTAAASYRTIARKILDAIEGE